MGAVVPAGDWGPTARVTPMPLPREQGRQGGSPRQAPGMGHLQGIGDRQSSQQSISLVLGSESGTLRGTRLRHTDTPQGD